MRVCPALLVVCISTASAHDLKPGSSFEQSIDLGAGEFTTIEITRSGGDLRASLKHRDAVVREVFAYSYSVAPIRIDVYSEQADVYRLTLSAPARQPVDTHFQLAVAPPRPPSPQELRRWQASRAVAEAERSGKLAAWDHATELLEQCGDTYALANALRAAGNLLMQSQDFRRAAERYSKAREILRASGWRFEEAIVRQNLASAQSELGQDRAAIAELDSVLLVREQIHDEYGRAVALFGRGKTWWHIGELQRALEDYTVSLSLWRKLGEEKWQATVLNALGLLNVDLGRYATASENYAEASSIARRLHDQSGLTMTVNNIGLMKERAGDHAAARVSFQETIRLAGELGDRKARAYALQNLGDVAANQGDHMAAMSFYRESLDLKRQLDDVRAAAETRRKMGLSYLDLNDTEAARHELETALEETRRISDRAGEAQSLAALARLGNALQQPAQAEHRISDAIAIVEHTRSALTTRDLRASYFSTHRDFYDLAMEVATRPEASGARGAFAWSERARARMLLDSVEQAGAESEPADVLARDPDEIRTTLLDPGAVLVEYAVAPQQTLAWVVTRDTLRMLKLPGAAVIAEAVRAVQSAPADQLNGALQRAARLVWWPLGIDPKAKRVVLAVDGGLEKLPFAALPGRHGRHLVTDHELVFAPSASLIAAMRKRACAFARRITVFADPVFSQADFRLDSSHRAASDAVELARLRFSREEARSIQHLAGRDALDIFLDFDATADALRRAASQPGVLHVATHAIADGSDPANSRLVFSRFDSLGRSRPSDLRLNDIYNLQLRRELVVLSACSTAAGPELRGEGVMSLTRAFLYAGASGVVASLWKVEDSASAELMKRFYARLLAGGPASAALREAQLTMLADARWRDIAKWAAFVYIGDWRVAPWGTTAHVR
jgi:tetratricopeptide (TPR) repeat protein